MGSKILILGQGRHGKDTVAEILRDKYSVSFMSSSQACAEVLKPALDVINGEKSVEEHFNGRHNHRELWMRLISLYNSYDKTALTKYILSKTDVYVGMRSLVEYNACVDAELFDYILYVDASDRVEYRDPTAEIEYDPETMIKIDNNGDLKQLIETVSLVYDATVVTHQTSVLGALEVILAVKDLFDGDSDLANDWLASPAAALSGVSPIDIINTRVGAETVLTLIGQIKAGTIVQEG